MKILIVNGANLNLVGVRQKDIYGSMSIDEYLDTLCEHYVQRGVNIEFVQTNIEGEIVDILQQAVGQFDAVVLNAGGYTHTSVVIADAVAAVRDMGLPTVEVHISNIMAREEFRHTSLIAPAALGTIAGFGLDGYQLAVSYLVNR